MLYSDKGFSQCYKIYSSHFFWVTSNQGHIWRLLLPLAGFDLQGDVDVGVWVRLLKKENFWQKSFFQIMLNEVLKNLEKRYLVENDIFQLWTFNLNGWSRYIELTSHVQVYWIFWEIFFFFFKSEIWAKYGQWCYCFKFLEEIRLHWLFHVGFGEIRFLIWLRFLFFQNIKSFQVCHYSS